MALTNDAINLCLNKQSGYHGNEASNELEVLEVIRVDVRGRVDLQTVVVLSSILKKTVHGIQNLVGQQEKPLPENDTRG